MEELCIAKNNKITFKRKENPLEYIDVVDENNILTGKIVPKNEIHERGLFYREVIGIIVNDKNEILLQKRASSKKEFANMWELCYGHVSSGEQPQEAMIRELKEENGLQIKDDDLVFVGIEKTAEYNVQSLRYHNVFSYVYLITTKNKITDYVFQKEEVSGGKYISIKKLRELFLKKDKNLAFINSKDFIKRLDLIEKILNGRNDNECN